MESKTIENNLGLFLNTCPITTFNHKRVLIIMQVLFWTTLDAFNVESYLKNE